MFEDDDAEAAEDGDGDGDGDADKTGSNWDRGQRSPYRTSENAFDSDSDVARALLKRSFSLLRVTGGWREELADGFQVLRYKAGQAYTPHTD